MQKLLMKLATIKKKLPLLHSTDVFHPLQLNQESKKNDLRAVIHSCVGGIYHQTNDSNDHSRNDPSPSKSNRYKDSVGPL